MEISFPSGIVFGSVRFLEENTETLLIRQNLLQPVRRKQDNGVMCEVQVEGGVGYAASPDSSDSGVEAALRVAKSRAEAAKGKMLVESLPRPVCAGHWQGPMEKSWGSLVDRIDYLQKLCASLKVDARIVDWESSLLRTAVKSRLLTSDDIEITQAFELVSPDVQVIAYESGQTQKRSSGFRGMSRQGGLEVLEQASLLEEGPALAREAIELLAAPECPTEIMSVVLAPDQMMLQIHESIGHPLELDRILGDERNFAGTSFVTPEMFGHYQYGSEALNVTFDPTVYGEYASYGFDDTGAPAAREFLIKNGLLLRGLGGVSSQKRLNLFGVSTTRASSWSRPPIDRMANLNIEPGTESLEELIGRVERGVYLRTNTSWSIDDARNKFQFGCEWGQLIEEGRLTSVVKNPNYRGISASFWRNLAGVGKERQVMGTPYCGKGEPNQIIRVGHASPPCLFNEVAVFGSQG
jgi:predicted Zn-dependent protease